MTTSPDLSRVLRRGSIGSLAVKVLSAAIGLGLTVLMARILGADGFGLYSWVFSLVLIAAVPLKSGLAELVVRQVAVYQTDGDWSLLRGLLDRADHIVLGVSLAVGVLVGGGVLLLSDQFADAGKAPTIGWGLVLLPLMALTTLRGAALRGLRRVVVGQLPEKVLRPGLLLCVLALATLRVDVRAPEAMAYHGIAAGLSLAAGAVILGRVLPDEAGEATPEFRDRSWLASIGPLAFVGGMQVINNQADIFLLGFFQPASEVGFYRMGVKGAEVILFPLYAANQVVAPYISRAKSGGDWETLQEIVQWASGLLLLVAVPAALFMILFGRPLLGFVFGQEFVAAYSPLVILVAAQLVNVGAGCVTVLLNMTGHEKDAAFGVAIAAGLNIVLNLVLIPMFGMMGAAWATVATVITWNVILCKRAYEQLGIVTTVVDWSSLTKRRGGS